LQLDKELEKHPEDLISGKMELAQSTPPAKPTSEPPLDIPISDATDDEGERTSSYELKNAAESLSDSVNAIVEASLVVLGRQTALANQAALSQLRQDRQARLTWIAIILLAMNLFSVILVLRTHNNTLNKLADVEARSASIVKSLSQLTTSATQTATSAKQTASDIQEIKADKPDIQIVSSGVNQTKLVIRSSKVPQVVGSAKAIEIPIKLPRNAELQ
jgi:hypothetical protein